MLNRLRARKTLIPVALSLALMIALLLLPTGYEGALSYQNADRVRAEVLDTDESDIVDTGLVRSGEQRCRVKILGGQFKGQEVDAVNRLNGSLAQDKLFRKGDAAYVVVSHSGGAVTSVTMSDHFRLDKEALLAGLFLLLLLVFARGTGLRAILSFVDTILLMWKVLVPCLLKGCNPIWVAMGLVLLLTVLILSLIYGLDRRCAAAVSGRVAEHTGHGGAGLSVYRSVPHTRRGDGVQREPALRRLCPSQPDEDIRRVHIPRLVRRGDGSGCGHLLRRV